MKTPWFKFYPADWRADPALRSCSLAARGLWMEMLCIMHESEPRGHLLIGKSAVSPRQLASISGVPLKETHRLLGELETAKVFSRNRKIIYSRRMIRDSEKADRDKANGKTGGNPALKGGVNPQDKAQILEARSQKEEKKDAAGAANELFALEPDAELFRRGKEVLGGQAGGLIAKLKRAKQGSVPLTRAAIETAATKQNPREYVGRIINGAAEDADPNSPAAWSSGIPGVT